MPCLRGGPPPTTGRRWLRWPGPLMAATRAAVAKLRAPSPTGRRSLALCRVADRRPRWWLRRLLRQRPRA
eukprot:15221090-Alexandrium_andersonii.AAC.1